MFTDGKATWSCSQNQALYLHTWIFMTTMQLIVVINVMKMFKFGLEPVLSNLLKFVLRIILFSIKINLDN